MNRIKTTLKSLSLNAIRSIVTRTCQLLVSHWKILLIPFVVIFTLFLLLFVFQNSLPFSIDALTADPLDTANLPFYIGIFSNLGVLLMASASALNFLGASILGRGHQHFQILVLSGIFTLGFALDDLFMFHDRILPGHLHFPEKLAYGGYFLFIILYLLYFLRDIYTYTNYTLMIFALAALGISVINIVLDFSFPKDGTKFLGLVYLFFYYFNTVKKFIQNDFPR